MVKELAAKWLSQLVGLCRNRKPSPMSKIVKNLCLFACCDPHCTPGMSPPEGRAESAALSHRKGKSSKSGGPSETQSGARDGGSPPSEADGREKPAWKWNTGIISLVRLKQDVRFASISWFTSVYIVWCLIIKLCRRPFLSYMGLAEVDLQQL